MQSGILICKAICQFQKQILFSPFTKEDKICLAFPSFDIGHDRFTLVIIILSDSIYIALLICRWKS